MRKRISFVANWFVAIPLLVALPAFAAAQRPEPIAYTVRLQAPETHIATVEARIPTGNQTTVDLMMAVWSPGYYVQEDYATQVKDLVARTADGKTLHVEQPQPNHWRVQTEGVASIVLAYSLQCDRHSVTFNWVGSDYAVLNGAPTFITLLEQTHRPHDVVIELPAQWKQTATSLSPASDGQPNHYVAVDYDDLVDSPIVAGPITFHEFNVAGSTHYLADVGEIPPAWDERLATENLEKLARANYVFWGFLPFRKYVFLNVFGHRGGGLEHLYSTLLSASPNLAKGGDMRWLQFVSHEYFHAFNVKRLRPLELGPFDYEHAPSTPSLWISEGVTTYYGNLMASRGGVGTTQDVLDALSRDITALQNTPGRLAQTLEHASLDVFSIGGSGVGGDRSKVVNYYVKGFIVGLLLDARIQHASSGTRSFDDLMRLAYTRYGGPRGFTPEQWVATASEVAGTDLSSFFRQAIQSTDELDYSEALDWFGLRFAVSDDPMKAWTLEVRPDATPAQRARLKRLAAPR